MREHAHKWGHMRCGNGLREAVSAGDPPPDKDHVWRYVAPRLGKARLSKYVGRMRLGMVVDVTGLRGSGMVAWVETE